MLETLSTALLVTASRTVVNRGLISRDSSQVQHADVWNVQVDQSVTQRLLNIGNLDISSSGQDDLEVTISNIPVPAHVVKVIRENQQ